MMAAAREKGKSLATLSCFYFYSVKNISKLLQWFLFWPMGYLQMFRFQIYEVFSRHLSVIFSKFNSSVVRGYSLYQLNSFTFIETCLKAHLMIYLGQLFRYIWKKILGRMLVDSYSCLQYSYWFSTYHLLRDIKICNSGYNCGLVYFSLILSFSVTYFETIIRNVCI